ncbi:MAG: hypothetical protein ACRC50_09625 [Gaiella sp.]
MWWVAIVAGTVALLAPGGASAHAPRFFSPANSSAASPLRVEDGTVSVAAYGVLSERTRTLVLAVRLRADAREPLEVLQPAGSATRPSVRVSIRSPGGAWRRLAALSAPERFFEPYGGQSYVRTHAGRIGGRAGWTLIRVELPAGVDRRAVCVATGTREVGFAGIDLPAAVERIGVWARG